MAGNHKLTQQKFVLPERLEDSEKLEQLRDYITTVQQAANLSECWTALKRIMARYGYDRIQYARKPRAEPGNLHNLFDMLYLSELGADYDAAFFEDNNFAKSYNVKWVMANSGSFSWRILEERYAAGLMDAGERLMLEINLEHGVKCGVTYTPTNDESHYQSGFGLCFRAGFDHEHADQVWEENEAEIRDYLDIFDIAASLYPYVPPENELTEKQCQVLEYAAKGYTISTITELTGWHRRTVDSHMASARERLQVANTTQAVMKAALQGQI